MRALGELHSLPIRVAARGLKEGAFTVKDVGDSVPERIILSLFF